MRARPHPTNEPTTTTAAPSRRAQTIIFIYAPPLARNAFPATPARFMGRF
ncbi:hypothetical protein [Citrobacter koseri]|nr:hypothetical protein [Citrobacter koseri]HEJ0424315.1 hypothetical protein [Citrobacter koseri]HEM6693204.1 hypothetical protein [Citrobacter koseri]